MTFSVANFLAENVLCILDDPTDDSQRIGAREFGVWICDLPTLIGASQPLTLAYHPIASAPASRRASGAGGWPRRPPFVLGAISQNLVLDHDGSDGTLTPALDLVLNDEDEDEEQQAEVGLRSLATTERRKRRQKGKGMAPSTDHVQISERLALASQTLVRELSRQTRSTTVSAPTFLEVPPAQRAAPAPVSPSVTKRQSRWKLSFGKSAGETDISGTNKRIKASTFPRKLENDGQDCGETGVAISLSKPFQRLLKYPLLFQDLHLHTDPSTFEYESILGTVAEVEIEDENIQKEERDKMRDILSRIEGMDKVKELTVPKPSRVLVEERILAPRELSDTSKPSPPPVGNTKAKRGKTSFKRVLQDGKGGVRGKKDMWLIVFNDVVLRCQRTGTTSLPWGSPCASQVNSLHELQGKSEDATTSRGNSTARPRNLYKFIKVGFRPFFRSGSNLTMSLRSKIGLSATASSFVKAWCPWKSRWF